MLAATNWRGLPWPPVWLSHGYSGGAALTLQTFGPQAACDLAACSRWFTAQAEAAGFTGLAIHFRTNNTIDWGQDLDHERKFNYFQTGAAEPSLR